MYVAGKEIDGAAIRRAAFQLFLSLTISITLCFGAGKEIRTPDPRLGKAMLYH